MKKLFLLRHAKASREFSILKDIERPLTERGFHDAKLVSEQFKKKIGTPGLIISSPAVRAYSTAIVFASAFHYPEDRIQLNGKLYNSSVEDYLEVIMELDPSCETAMIVGHNEVMTDTVKKLIHDSSFESLRTCAVAALSCDIKSWNSISSKLCRLESVLFPALLKEV